MKQDKWVAGFDLEEFFSMDASYLVDSLGKGMSDMYEDEGIAYVIGNVATNIAIGKFLGELKNVKAPVVANEAYDVIGTTTVFDFDSGIFLEAEIVRLTGQNALVSMAGGEIVPWGSLGKSTMGASAFGALNLNLEGYIGGKYSIDKLLEGVVKGGSDIVTINTSGDGASFGQLNPVSSLNQRQRDLLELLGNSGDTAIVSKKSVSMNDLRQLTNVTGDEFDMFTNGAQRLIIRGQGTKVNVSEEMLNDIYNGVYGTFSGHTHLSGYSLEPGPSDEPFLKALDQEISSVWGTTGDGWLPFGKESWFTEEIREKLRRATMEKFYGNQ